MLAQGSGVYVGQIGQGRYLCLGLTSVLILMDSSFLAAELIYLEPNLFSSLNSEMESSIFESSQNNCSKKRSESKIKTEWQTVQILMRRSLQAISSGSTVKPQWLEHLWDHVNVLETWVV